jgi:hypothetical protein
MKEVSNMTQEELYELAKTLKDKEVAYLICAHMEHINKSTFGFEVRANGGIFFGEITFNKTELNDDYTTWDEA